jgi:hypothetical protein
MFKLTFAQGMMCGVADQLPAKGSCELAAQNRLGLCRFAHAVCVLLCWDWPAGVNGVLAAALSTDCKP